MDIKEYVTEKLKEMIKDKDDKHIAPNHILSNELFNAIIVDVRTTLNSMVKDGTIEVCKTLNNIGIKLK